MESQSPVWKTSRTTRRGGFSRDFLPRTSYFMQPRIVIGMKSIHEQRAWSASVILRNHFVTLFIVMQINNSWWKVFWCLSFRRHDSHQRTFLVSSILKMFQALVINEDWIIFEDNVMHKWRQFWRAHLLFSCHCLQKDKSFLSFSQGYEIKTAAMCIYTVL